MKVKIINELYITDMQSKINKFIAAVEKRNGKIIEIKYFIYMTPIATQQAVIIYEYPK